MPAEGIHLTALREAAASPGLSGDARRALVRWEDAARLGAVLLDFAYFDRYLEEVARYALKLSPRSSPWGATIHEGAAIRILHALVDRARSERSATIAALALGVASHAAIDRALHPLVNALARRYAAGRAHDAAHREVEKFQSICFHERYFGRDRMGTPGIVRLVAVPAREVLAIETLGDAVETAFARALDAREVAGPLARMARGYEQHARLLGSPLGAVIASEREKMGARPKFLTGAWGTFEAVLEQAVAASVAVLEATWSVYAASERDLDASRRALDRLLPAGTIDGDGASVDLDAAYVLRG